jgi:Tfp pilus assembly protein PilV
MNKIVDIRNESGFGLIHVLAVTLIVSIALLGLFMSIEYAKAQADVNYHTRAALLLGQGYIEEIKYNNRNMGSYSRPSINHFTEVLVLDDNKGRSILATVTVTGSTGGNPYSVPSLLSTFRDEARVTVSWQEKPSANLGSAQNKTHSVYLREDYYWKRSGVDVQ